MSLNQFHESIHIKEHTNGCEEDTIECTTREEYDNKKKAYLDAIFLQTVDVSYIMEHIALPEYRKHISSKRVDLLDKLIHDGKIVMNTKDAYYASNSSSEMKEAIHSYRGKKKKPTAIPGTGVYICNDISVEGTFGLFGSENIGVKVIEGTIIEDSSNTVSYKKSMIEWNYVCTSLYIKNYINTPLIIFDKPVRPLPPKTLDNNQTKNAEVALEIEKNKILLNNNNDVVLKAFLAADNGKDIIITPATFSENDGEKFTIGNEVVDKKTYELYRQYKKDWMIPTDLTGGTMPKPGTPEKYQNLSREYFKTVILDKDEKYRRK